MMRSRNSSSVVLTAVAAVAGALMLSAPSAASTPTYGEHVSDCARSGHFSATHNPGMHRGASDWDGMPCMR